MGQKWGPSVAVVGGLIALAVVVAMILWYTMISGGGDSSMPAASLPENLAAPAEPTPDESVISDEPIADPEPAGASTIVSVTTFDPTSDGGNGEENDDLLGNLTDGDTSTSWRTQCYSNQFMGAKGGVGVIVSFDAPLDRDLTVQFSNGPFNMDVYGSDQTAVPTTLDGWGEPVDQSFGADADSVTASVAGIGATHVLLRLRELGPNDFCSDDNPFSGEISEISIA